MKSKTSSKNTSIIVKEPEVSGNINMNLSHNDVIDVAIQTQLELLEPQEESLRKELKELDSELESMQEKIILKLIEKSKDSSMIKKFKTTVQSLTKDLFEDIVKIDSARADRYGEAVHSPEFMKFNHSGYDPEDYKAPLQFFKRRSHPERIKRNLPDVITFDMSVIIDGIKLKPVDSFKFALSEKEKSDYKTKLQKVMDKKADMENKHWNITKEILELKYDEKKIKARVVKQSLSKTTQGKSILSLLESATNIKLLE